MIMRIESRQNAVVKHLARLGREKKYRRSCGEFVCEGGKMLEEALRSGAQVTSVLVQSGVDCPQLSAAEAQGAKLYEAPGALFAHVSHVETPQGVLFACRIPESAADDIAEMQNVLLLDGVQDPGNLGTILRTAEAFALGGVILCEGCADLYAPKVVRATMGAIFRLPVFRLPLLDAVAAAKQSGMPVYATALAPDSIPMHDVALAHAAVIIGSEGRGVTQAALENADCRIIIPMAGRAESLNAGVAASILIYEMTKEATGCRLD